LVGGAQGSQRYAEQLRAQYRGNEAIVCTGFLSPPEVQQLISHAGIFALPSSHEGLPIALLEAMKIGVPVVVSNIAANREVGLDDSCYFPMGDTRALAVKLRERAAMTPDEREIIAQQLRLCCGRYDWDAIAKLTMQVLEGVVGTGTRRAALNRANPFHT
jgi:glycosyltransferase involved in cell wall biosynthesis